MLEYTDIFGRRIKVTEFIWENHILSSRHWMRGWADTIQNTIKEPEAIYFDRQFENRECFYSRGTPYNPQRLFKVVVEFDAENIGTVVTAYPSRNIPKKGNDTNGPNTQSTQQAFSGYH